MTDRTSWSKADWDAAYSNVDQVPDSSEITADWGTRAEAFRASHKLSALDLPYGKGSREKFDLFLPDQLPPKGLVIYIHGGYWLRFDKSSFSHFAAGAVKLGYAVAIPSYDLKPGPHMKTLVAQVEQALMHAMEHVGGPVHVIGHSAGGHLAAMLMREDNGLSEMAKLRLKRIIGISGVYDLEPLTHLTMQKQFGFTPEEVETQSPQNLKPVPDVDFISWVGGEELPEFQRQSKEFAAEWVCGYHEAADVNHFTVVHELEGPESYMLKRLLA